MDLKPVLFISYDGMTDPLGQSQVLPYLIGLTKRGWSVSILSFEKIEKFKAGKDLIYTICNEAGIDWHPLMYTKKPPVISTVKDVRRMKKKAIQLHLEKKFALIHCRSYISALAGLYLKKKYNIPYIFDMRGFWADERVDGGLWKLSNPLYKSVYRYFKKKEIQFINQSGAVVSLTHNAKNEILSWSQVNKKTEITVIPCCVDVELFDPEKISVTEQLQLRDKLSIDNTATVLTYIGSIGTWYLLDEMLLFFKQWLQYKPESIFLFVTTESPQMILETCKKQGINENSIRITPALRKEVPIYISICNYSVFFITPSFSKKASSPTKQAEIMAMGKTAICNSGVGDSDYVINKYNSGFLIDQLTVNNFNKVIPGILNSVPKNNVEIRKGCEDFFSLNKGIDAYEKIYKQLTY